MTFSVLIPCFNLAPWIGACLDSVRAQTYGDWECVIVDDGSTDGSGEIVEKATAGDGRFRIIRQQNAGVGAARNAALAAAQGEWVVFLDGDDVLLTAALERIAAAVKMCPQTQAVRFGYMRFEDYDDHSDFGVSRSETIEFRDCRRAVPMTALRSYLWQISFRRTVVEGLRFTRYCRGEDGLFLVEAFLGHVDSYVDDAAVLYGYRRRRGSAMQIQIGRKILLDELDHRRDIARLVAQTDKIVDCADPLWREWIEDYYLNHWRLLRSVHTEWLEHLRELLHMSVFSRWGALRARIAVRFPWTLRLISMFGRRR